MFNSKFFVGSIVVSFGLALAGCQSPATSPKPSASATPVASASPSPTASPTATVLSTEAATYLKKVEDAAKSIIAKAVGGATEEGPRFVDTTSSTEGAYIELDGKLLIVLPEKAVTAKKTDANADAKVSDKAKAMADTLTTAAIKGDTVVKTYASGNASGRVGVLTNQVLADTKNWHTVSTLYDIVKDSKKIGEMKVHTFTNLFSGEKALEIEYSALEDVRIELGSTPVYLSKTSKEAPTAKRKLEKVATVNPAITFGDQTAYSFGVNGQTLAKVVIPDQNWDSILNSIEKIGKEATIK